VTALVSAAAGPDELGNRSARPTATSGLAVRVCRVPLDQIISIECRRGQLEIERRRGTLLRIGNLDGIGALLELSDALTA
jgi:hypothetical protein